MDDIRTYEDVKNEILSTIYFYEDRIKMWEAVKFPTKKDGSPFKALSKNFDGAEIGKYYPVEEHATPYLTVCGSVRSPERRSYVESDHMQIYMERHNKRLPEHNEDREVRYTAWGNEVEILTLDEIKSEIQYRIEDFTRHKNEAEEALKISEEKFAQVQEKILEIKEIVYGEDIKCSTLEYALQGYVKGFGRYIR